MSRKIESGKRLSRADREYVLQRSWLRAELGLTAEDLARDVPEDPSYNLTDPPHTPDEVRAVPKAGSAESPEQKSYSDLKVDQLVDELKDRGLSTTGNKAELVARLKEDDEASNQGE